jgi:CHAT domain-containing protein
VIPEEALRQAQLAVRDQLHEHPAWWSGFRLSGGGGALPAPADGDGPAAGR